MLFINLVNATLAKLREEPISELSTDQTTIAYKVQIAVNRAIARVWNYRTWAFKRQTFSLVTVADQADNTLPKGVGEVYSIRASTYPYKITPVPKHLFDLYIPNPQEEGNPRIGVLSDFLGASTQPSAASTITVVSSSASDTTQSVLIKGTVGGQEDYEVVALNGTTSATTTKAFSNINSVTKSDVTAGRVTLTSNSGAVTNLVFGPLLTTFRWQKLTLYPTPSANGSLTIHAFALPPVLTHKWEDALIPDRWAYVVEQWAFLFALQPKGKEQLDEQQAQLNLAESMLKIDMASEEVISVEEPLVSLRVGEGGYSHDGGLPDGYGRIVD